MKLEDVIHEEKEIEDEIIVSPGRKGLLSDSIQTEASGLVDDNAPTTEEQEQYTQVVSMGVMMISEPKTNKMILGMLRKQGNRPVEALAKTSLMIATKIDEKLQGEIPPEIIIPAAAEVLEQVADFAVESKVMNIDQKILNDSGVYLMRALMEYFEFTEEEMQEIRDEAPNEVKELVGAQQQQDQMDANKVQEQDLQRADYENRTQNARL